MSSNEHPDMSGSGCDDDESTFGPDDMERAFIAGDQQMREMLSRFVEQSPGDPNPHPTVIAGSMRANWVPNWGKDPGKPDDVYGDMWKAL